LLLCDVNVLVYAHREDSTGHRRYREWLEALVNGEQAYAMSGLVLSGFMRVVTHPKVFERPSTLRDAIAFCAQLREQPGCVHVQPGPRHWDIFRRLCLEGSVRGNLVSDAYIAALAMESGCELVTTDRDFGRFEGLRWRPPFQ
jgi:toxin-antitoxin system PIN domain toxin